MEKTLEYTSAVPQPSPGSALEVLGVSTRLSRSLAIGAWILFVGLLLGLPLLRYLLPSQPLAVFDSFFRVGCLVFRGGYVVLPLIQAEVVPPGWVTTEQFIAGYGAAQAVPGPLFTCAAYLGAVMCPWPNGWLGAALALGTIVLPSFLLLVGGLPLWNRLRAQASFQAMLRGINAAVVGLLLAALYRPVWTSAIQGARRLCARAGGLSAVGVLEMAPLAGRRAVGTWGRGLLSQARIRTFVRGARYGRQVSRTPWLCMTFCTNVQRWNTSAA
jgi:putative chromate ion transporter